MLMEIGVDGHRHVMADAHHGTEGVGAQTHMGILAHHFKALALLLHGIGVVTKTIHLQSSSLDLAALSGTLALHQHTFCTDTGPRGNILQELLVELCRIDDNLYILDGGAIVQGDEVDSLRAAVRAHPAFHADIFSVFCTSKYIDNLCSLHN